VSDEGGDGATAGRFAALLVKEDFVLMTATNKTLLGQQADWAAEMAVKRR
jgi:hypothetical protein